MKDEGTAGAHRRAGRDSAVATGGRKPHNERGDTSTRAAPMPIRFRCRHCDQLLGIARRKAGSPVKCPTCRNEVLVPLEDEAPAPPPMEPSPPPPAPNVFDREDFDDLLAGGTTRGGGGVAAPAPPVTRPPAAPAQSPANSWSQHQAAPSTPPATGLVLSPGRATLLAVVFVLLLAVSFVAGLLVGRFAL